MNDKLNLCSTNFFFEKRFKFLQLTTFLSFIFCALNAQNVDYSKSITKPLDKYHIDLSVAEKTTLKNAIFENAISSTSFHLFSHGKPGQLFLNNQWKDADQIIEWFSNYYDLAYYTNLNIYGCNFAKGEKGKAAIDYLEAALGVSIAASDDITGIDGDWELEAGEQNNSIQLKDYLYNLQDCTNVDPNALVNTYPQVFTCGADDVTDPVIGMSDATNLSINPATQLPNKFSNTGWTLENIGNIYFTEFDGVGCLYAPASVFTQGDNGLQQFGLLGGADAIYKMDAVTGAPSVWATLNTSGKGYGGITYDPFSNTMYVVNLGDNTIYQLDMSGNVLDSFQPSPATLGVVNDASGSGLAINDFQNHPFGLDINPVDGKLYYTVIDATDGGSMVVRSVDRNKCGNFQDATDQEEINFVMQNTFETGNSIFPFESDPVSGDIDFNASGDMALGSWSTGRTQSNKNYYVYGNTNSMYNHTSAIYTFSGASGAWTQTAITSVGTFPYTSSFDIAVPNGTATGGVAWDIDNPDILWMSGADIAGVDGDWGIIGYDVNQLDNVYDQEDATNYIRFLFEPQVNPDDDPKGNGGDVDVFSCPPCVPPAPPVVTVINNVCPDTPDGSFNVATPCGAGSTLEWSIDGCQTFSATPPAYDNVNALMVVVRCVDDTAGCQSNIVNLTTSPVGECGASCPPENCINQYGEFTIIKRIP